ncbi:MAG: FHA domain-containing serine/threonine-protein kinase [Coriobacteriia bacterium]
MTAFLGPYEIRGRLGTGAMAVVWRAWDPKLEREVAIKEPVRSPTMSESMASELGERFVREGKTSAHLSHPGIVTIYAADVFDGRPAIVMELLRGHSLSALIDRGALPFDATISILDQLLDALDYAHGMGVVHRDVKPDNILVTDDGRLKLTDFGVAHVSRLDTGAEQIIAGTPGYMAPEQIRAEPVDARADVFGIGAIAYEMFAGRNPFGATDGLDSQTIMSRTLHGGPVAFSSVDSVPSAVEVVVLRALERDAALRYPSAAAMRIDLQTAALSRGLGGTGSLADLIENAGPIRDTSVSFTTTTVDVIKDRVPEKGSAGWVVGAAAAAAAAVLILVAVMSGPGMGIGILVLGGLGIAGFYWYTSKRSHETAHELPPEAIAMSAGLQSPSYDAALQLRGPREDRVTYVSLPCTMGRSSEAELIVADDLVSRRHARIERRGNELYVVDLGSSNGVFVNGVLVGSAMPAGVGSIIVVGSTEVIVLESR